MQLPSALEWLRAPGFGKLLPRPVPDNEMYVRRRKSERARETSRALSEPFRFGGGAAERYLFCYLGVTRRLNDLSPSLNAALNRLDRFLTEAQHLIVALHGLFEAIFEGVCAVLRHCFGRIFEIIAGRFRFRCHWMDPLSKSTAGRHYATMLRCNMTYMQCSM